MKLVTKKQPIPQIVDEVQLEEPLTEPYTPFYIVYKESHYIENHGKHYSSRARAEAAMKRTKFRNGKLKFPPETHQVMSLDEYRAGDTLVESTNMMSGEKIMIPRSQKGGCCDPGTERYWSM